MILDLYYNYQHNNIYHQVTPKTITTTTTTKILICSRKNIYCMYNYVWPWEAKKYFIVSISFSVFSLCLFCCCCCSLRPIHHPYPHHKCWKNYQMKTAGENICTCSTISGEVAPSERFRVLNQASLNNGLLNHYLISPSTSWMEQVWHHARTFIPIY